MRLKFLFFPIILIISIFLFAGYIWPEIKNLKNANKEKIANQNALQAIIDKQAAIERIDGKINEDIEGETMINNYLPSQKIEEKILTSINFLSSDAGVSLTSIDLLNESDSKDSDDIDFPSPFSAMEKSAPKVEDKVVSSGGLQSVQASVLVEGEYAKIKLFLDELQKLPMYNSIKNLEISSKEEDGEGDVRVLSSNLIAKVVVDFGYMDQVKMDNKKIATFKPEIDDSIGLAIKQYISQKSPSVEGSGDKNGKSNPFLP